MESELEKFNSGMHYFMVDAKTVSEFSTNENSRVICRLADKIEFHCAFMPKKEGGFFVNIGSKIRKQLNLEVGDKITAKFSNDVSKYQFETPEEFTEVLKLDTQADEIFHSLTEGNQRGLIYLVRQVKSSDKRIERALKIADALKCGITQTQKISLK
jgi:hypothetical protein